MQFKCSVHEEGINSTAAPTQCKCMQIRKAAEMSKSAEFWNCLYYTELLLQPIFNELSALAVEVSCFLKLTSTDFSPREKKLRSEKKLRQKIRSLLLVVLLLKKPKHFARKKKTTSRNTEKKKKTG